MQDLNIPLLIAALSVLVGLLCLGLWVTAQLRIGKAKKAGGAVGGESVTDLRGFARNQLLSAVVMFVLAAAIIAFS